MLFKISMKNIKKSIKDYVIYFVTLMIGVAIFYIFNAIESQTVLLNVTKNTEQIIKLMISMLNGVSVFVSVVLGLLIIYASRFLMKRRNKEFGLYIVLGMEKRKISLILFFETLLVGLISLVVGLLAGVALSQLMSGFVANMFDADMTKYTFIFSQNACRKTIIYYGIMYMIVILFNTVSINRYQLIDLLQAGKKSEIIKMKSPLLCVLVFIAAVIGLGSAYYMVTDGALNFLDTADKILIPIGLGAVSTFFIFWSVSGLLLKLVMSVKKVYFHELNSFTLRQISSKINTTVFSMTIICLMLFVTICVLASAFSIKNSMDANLEAMVPADIQLKKSMNLNASYLEEGYSSQQIASTKYNITALYENAGIDIGSCLREYVQFYTYATPDVTLADTLGGKLEAFDQMYAFLAYDTPEEIVKVSDYNRLARLYGLETYSLNEDEYMIVANYESMVVLRNAVLAAGQTVNIFGYELKPKYTECQPGYIEMSTTHVNTGVIIVPDAVVDESYARWDNLIGNYNADSKEEKLEIEEKMVQLESLGKEYLLPSGNSKIELAEASIGLGAMVTFIGIYLGIIFLISCAAILALKELSESVDNIERFQILRRLGADEGMISSALFKQIGIFFAIPLVLACIHSIYGMKFSMFLLSVFGTDEVLFSVIMTAVVVVLIYGGYFVITYLYSRNIIRDARIR